MRVVQVAKEIAPTPPKIRTSTPPSADPSPNPSRRRSGEIDGHEPPRSGAHFAESGTPSRLRGGAHKHRAGPSRRVSVESIGEATEGAAAAAEDSSDDADEPGSPSSWTAAEDVNLGNLPPSRIRPPSKKSGRGIDLTSKAF